jgi:hypothetical protein
MSAFLLARRTHRWDSLVSDWCNFGLMKPGALRTDLDVLGLIFLPNSGTELTSQPV